MSWVGWLLVGGGVVLFLVIVLFVWSLCRIAALADREALDLTQEDLACPAGIEPATPSLEGSCSVQLSYGHGDSDSTARLPLGSKLCDFLRHKPTNETGIAIVSSLVESRNVNAGSANVTSSSSGADRDCAGDPNCAVCVRRLVYSSDLDLFYCATEDCPKYRHVQIEGKAWREMEVASATSA
jgi:hypothetical protein